MKIGVAFALVLVAACGGPTAPRLCAPPAGRAPMTDSWPRRDPRAPLTPEMRDFDRVLRSGRAACEIADELVSGAARIAAAPTPPAMDARQHRGRVLVLRVSALQLATDCRERGAGDLGPVERAFDQILLPIPC